MLGIGVGAAVEVGDESAGALVAALAAAEHGADVLVAGVIDGLNSLEEVLGGPGVVLQVDVLQRVGRLKDVLVDGHAVRGHADRQLENLAVGAGAGAGDAFIGALGDEIAQIEHQALGAPVGDQTLGPFHDDVGSLAALNSGVDLVVAVGVVEILDLYGDLGMDLIERVDEALDRSLVGPLADGIGPQRDGDVVIRERGGADQSKDHDQRQHKSENFFMCYLLK